MWISREPTMLPQDKTTHALSFWLLAFSKDFFNITHFYKIANKKYDLNTVLNQVLGFKNGLIDIPKLLLHF